MDHLARREHSKRELVWKLSRRFPERDVQRAVDELAEEGLQSDERFADSFTRERFLRAQGPRRIRLELEQRFVKDDLIDAALAKVVVDEGKSWNDLARDALRQRFGSSPDADLREKARRQRFLYRRGFEPSELRGEPVFEGMDQPDR